MKWVKKKFENVELNTDEPPEVFKMQLFSLSGRALHAYRLGNYCLDLKGVSPERQKVMIGGISLADNEWGKAVSKIKEVLKISRNDSFNFLYFVEFYADDDGVC